MKKIYQVLFFLLVLMVPSISHAAVLWLDPNTVLIIDEQPLPSNWTVIDFSQFDHDFIETHGPVQIGSLVGEDITVDSGFEYLVPLVTNPPPSLSSVNDSDNNPPENLLVPPVLPAPLPSDSNNNPPGTLPSSPISPPCTSGSSASCLPVSPPIPSVPSIGGGSPPINVGPSPEEFKLLIGNGVYDLGVNGTWNDEREGYIVGQSLDFQFNDQPINSFGFLFNFESPSTLALDFAGKSIMLGLTSTEARPNNRGIYLGISSTQQFDAFSLNASKRAVFDDVSFSRTFDVPEVPEPTLPLVRPPTPPTSPFAPQSPTPPTLPTSPKTPKAPTPPNLDSLFGPTPIVPSVPTIPDSFAFYSTLDLDIDQPVKTIVNPEPTSMLLFGTGLAGVLLRRRRT